MSSAWNSLEFAITGGHCVYELTDIVRTCVWRNIFLQNVLQGSHWKKRSDKLKKSRGGIRFGSTSPPSLTFFGWEKVCRSWKMITDFFIEYLGIFAYVMCSWFGDWFQYILFYRKCVISCAVSFDAVDWRRTFFHVVQRNGRSGTKVSRFLCLCLYRSWSVSSMFSILSIVLDEG